MNSTQMACLQKLVNALQECEAVGLTFSYTSVLINVEDDESHYLESLSSEKLSNLLNFIDGCGVFAPKTDDNEATSFGYDNGSRVGDHPCLVEIKDGVVQSWEVFPQDNYKDDHYMALAEEAGGGRITNNIIQMTSADLERFIYFTKDAEDDISHQNTPA